MQVYDVGDVVYTQGEPGHWFYVVDSGEFEMCVSDPVSLHDPPATPYPTPGATLQHRTAR